jgi:hypothetical protein
MVRRIVFTIPEDDTTPLVAMSGRFRGRYHDRAMATRRVAPPRHETSANRKPFGLPGAFTKPGEFRLIGPEWTSVGIRNPAGLARQHDRSSECR